VREAPERLVGVGEDALLGSSPWLAAPPAVPPRGLRTAAVAGAVGHGGQPWVPAARLFRQAAGDSSEARLGIST